MPPCLICYSEQRSDSIITLHCGCQSCNNCFQSWAMSQLTLSTKIEFRCPMPECKTPLTDYEVSELFSLEVKAALDKAKLQRYLRDTVDIKNCPTPTCAYAGFASPLTTQKSFSCEACGSCWTEAQSNWLVKRIRTWREDNLSKLWKAYFCMTCPSCNICIEKDQGCKHMSCFQCGFEFCWLCKGNWKTHREPICAGHGSGSDALLATGLAISLLLLVHLLMQWTTIR